jgi:hypothetical protein
VTAKKTLPSAIPNEEFEEATPSIRNNSVGSDTLGGEIETESEKEEKENDQEKEKKKKRKEVTY